MDNNHFVSLWDSNTEIAEYKPLRRPNLNSVANIDNNKSTSEESIEKSAPVNVATETTDFNDILNKSRLSVDAKEWFPASYIPVHAPPQATQVHSAQSRLQRIRIENNMPKEHNMQSSQMPESFNPVNLNILIESLIYDPGQFDNLKNNFIAILEPYFDDVDVAIQTAEAIFEYALKEPSFRYNAARLCCILDENYPLFRPRLHILCEKELNAYTRLQGLTLFLAELYMQLNYVETVYGRCLLESLKKLISTRRPDDIKSACQALKLTGYSLEGNNKEILNEIFKELELSIPMLQQSLINVVESVFTLRNNSWGRNSSSSHIGNSSQEENGVVTTSSDEEYVLYGPDGQEITLEEQEFLCSNLEDTDYLGDESSDPDDLYNPEPEMDEEIQEAFREFVKMNKR